MKQSGVFFFWFRFFLKFESNPSSKRIQIGKKSSKAKNEETSKKLNNKPNTVISQHGEVINFPFHVFCIFAHKQMKDALWPSVCLFASSFSSTIDPICIKFSRQIPSIGVAILTLFQNIPSPNGNKNHYFCGCSAQKFDSYLKLHILLPTVSFMAQTTVFFCFFIFWIFQFISASCSTHIFILVFPDIFPFFVNPVWELETSEKTFALCRATLCIFFQKRFPLQYT